jgi:hypothetical protein
MKTNLFIVLLTLCLASSMVKAQTIPNNQFELLNYDGSLSYWGNVYIISVSLDSLGNSTSDSIVFDSQYYYGPTTDAHSGNTALLLSNSWNFTNNTGVAGAAGVDDDTVFTSWGLSNIISLNNTSGYNPNSLSIFYKFLPVNGDSGSAFVALWDSLGNLIGEGTYIFMGTTNNYTNLVIPITYNSFDAASFYSLSFSAFYSTDYGAHQPAFGSKLYIDDVTFETFTGINEQSSAHVKLFPNPANDILNLQFENELPCIYKIYDAFGKCVANDNLAANMNAISISQLSNGVYFIELKTNNLLSKIPFVVCK